MPNMFEEDRLAPVPSGFDTAQADPVPPVTTESAERNSKRLAENIRPLTEEIQKSGWDGSADIWEIKARVPADYQMLFPVLVEHLMRPYHPLNLEAIARALTLKAARPIAWEPLLKRLYEVRVDLRHPEDPYYRNCCLSLRDAIVNAISVMATKDDAGKLLELVQDENLGNSRILAITSFKRLFDPRVKQVLKVIRTQGKLAYVCDQVLRSKRYQ